MTQLDLNKLIDNFITERRLAQDKLFKTNGIYLLDIDKILGTDNKQDTIEHCISIIKTLITKYYYFGEYSCGSINAFLKIYGNAHKGSIPDSIKLQDITKSSGSDFRTTRGKILTVMQQNNYYYLSQQDISKFSSKQYNTRLVAKVKEIEEKQFLEEQMKKRQLEELKYRQLLEEQQRQQKRQKLVNDLEFQLDNKQRRFRQLDRKLYNLHQRRQEEEDQRLLQEIEELRLKEEEEQRLQQQELEEQYRQFTIEQQQKMIDKNNTVINEPLQNDFLTNKEMAQIPQPQPVRRARGKIGMNELANIVLNMQRDFKRVANALSVQGATDIIDKHNDKSPNAPWHLIHEDVNGDNIPDIIIRNENNEPIIVNGWTTKGSDYPERYQYYNRYPTREARRAHPYPTYKKDELYGIRYDMNNQDVHNRGNVTAFNQNPFPQGWNTSKYNVNSNPGKRLSAYRRFQKLIANPVLDMVVARFVEHGDIVLENEKWKDKMKYYAQVTAKLWENYIIRVVAQRNQLNPESKQFRKFKNSVNGKRIIDNTVTEFYYHLHHTSEQLDWTEEKRDGLQQDILHYASDELLKLLQHTAMIADNQHVYPEYHEENIQPFNPEIEGEFGAPW